MILYILYNDAQMDVYGTFYLLYLYIIHCMIICADECIILCLLCFQMIAPGRRLRPDPGMEHTELLNVKSFPYLYKCPNVTDISVISMIF